MAQLLHEELSYRVRGVLFDVYNQLGPMLPENFYQSAVAIGLEAEGIQCETEKQFEVTYRGVQVGRYAVDAWLEGGKILLELKVAPAVDPIHQAQAISYLKVTNADLAFVVNFGAASLQINRLPNYVRDKPIPPWQPAPADPQTLYPELTNELLAVLYRVYFTLGPGFLHQIYRRATMVELREQYIGFTYIKQTPIYYRDHHLGDQASRLISVDEKVLVATVALRQSNSALKAQLKARMRHHNVKLGILANFHGSQLELAFIR
jgi:GxxExxY protein